MIAGKYFKNELETPYGYIRKISFKDFVQRIKVEEVNSNKVCVQVESELDEVNSSYETWNILVELVPGGFNVKTKLDVIRYFLLEQAHMQDISNENIEESANTAVDDYAYGYGNPTHLVKVAKHLWMVANPEDFVIFSNSKLNKIGLFTKDSDLVTVYSIHKGEPKTFKILGQN